MYGEISKEDQEPLNLRTCHGKTVSRVGENVSATMNQVKLATSDNWFHSYEH
jgi:hypothetical protein